MNKKMSTSEALVAYINSIPDYLRSGIYSELLEAASKVKTAESAAVILLLLGEGSSYGSEIPSAPIKFLQDHSLHLKSGTEWYWISCNLEVEGSDGLDKIGVPVVITRNRAVSLDVQKAVGWTDEEAQVVDTAATVTVATRKDSFIARRRPNVQWSAVGGDGVKFGVRPVSLPERRGLFEGRQKRFAAKCSY
jgi:predicted secreted hydrolase